MSKIGYLIESLERGCKTELRSEEFEIKPKWLFPIYIRNFFQVPKTLVDKWEKDGGQTGMECFEFTKKANEPSKLYQAMTEVDFEEYKWVGWVPAQEDAAMVVYVKGNKLVGRVLDETVLADIEKHCKRKAECLKDA